MVLAAELTVGYILWPVTHVTHHSADPWPAWPVTHKTRDPVLDHGMSCITTIAFYSLQWCVIWNSRYGFFGEHFSSIYDKYRSLHSTLHGNFYKLNTLNSSLIFTFTPHLTMGQVFYGSDPWSTLPIHFRRLVDVDPFDPRPIDPLTHWLLWLAAVDANNDRARRAAETDAAAEAAEEAAEETESATSWW